jgi:hypothetical protein
MLLLLRKHFRPNEAIGFDNAFLDESNARRWHD